MLGCSVKSPSPPSHSYRVLLHFKTSPLGKVDLFPPQRINSLSNVVWDSLNSHTSFSKSSHGRQPSDYRDFTVTWPSRRHWCCRQFHILEWQVLRIMDGDIIFCMCQVHATFLALCPWTSSTKHPPGWRTWHVSVNRNRPWDLPS